MSDVRRRRWPVILLAGVVVVAAAWTAAWFYAANRVEGLVGEWIAREAQAGRVYRCGRQEVSGFPFSISVQCTDMAADLTTMQPPLTLRAPGMTVLAEVWQRTQLTGTITSPFTIAAPSTGEQFTARWSQAHVVVHGLPTEPHGLDIRADGLIVERADAEPLFRADTLSLDGRIAEGSARQNPVVQVKLALAGATAPTVHAALAQPTALDFTATLRGLRDFSPKPWPERFRELQAAGGRIDINNARIAQGDAISASSGTLGLSPAGRLDGQLALIVTGLERLLPVLGLDKVLPPTQNKQMNAAIGALDRFSPGLGNIARQNAAPALAASLAFLGQPTELEGRKAIRLPLRFSDGVAVLGPIQLGAVPPLY